jgi:UDP-glucuronate decarboxylase
MRADDGRVVSNVVTQALAGDDITIYGSGEQTRSFCYVDDLIDGLLRLMAYDGDYAGAVNLGNPAEITVRELVSRVLRLAASESQIVSRPLPVDDPQRRRPNIALATQLLGWTPRVSLERGLKKTIAYFAAEAAAVALPKTRGSGKGKAGVNGASTLLAKMKDAAIPADERSLIRP